MKESDIKTQIKNILNSEHKTATEIAKALNFGTPQNLNNKIARGTIRYSEILKIAEYLGYELKWEKKSKVDILKNNIDGIKELLGSNKEDNRETLNIINALENENFLKAIITVSEFLNR